MIIACDFMFDRKHYHLHGNHLVTQWQRICLSMLEPQVPFNLGYSPPGYKRVRHDLVNKNQQQPQQSVTLWKKNDKNRITASLKMLEQFQMFIGSVTLKTFLNLKKRYLLEWKIQSKSFLKNFFFLDIP